MSYHHRYKQRDYHFSHLLVTLRQRSGLTQNEVALKVHVAPKSIRNWEGGSNYPTDMHLQRLIELYLDAGGFEAGNEQEEARALWEQYQESAHRTGGLFNEPWFSDLLTRRKSLANSSYGQEPGALPYASDQKAFGLLSPAESVTGNTERVSALPHREDCAAALDVSRFAGREAELAMLERWVLSDRCRLVTILGMGGIGKTSLVAKLVQLVAPRFDCVLWRSLQNAPSLEDLLLDWLPVLAEQHDILPPSQNIDKSLTLLLQLMQQRRCLLVLDNLDTLFQERALEGYCRPGYEGYAVLMKQIAEAAHQSCLLLTSREQFIELGGLVGEQAPVRVLKLGSLALPASQQLLHDKLLSGSEEAWGELVSRYAGNPLALKIVAETIREIFDGDITAFLSEECTTFRGVRQLLAQQFERLSSLEQELMYWLAIEREPISLDTLRTDLLHSASKSAVVEAIQSLYSRSLVERSGRGVAFTLQPVVLAYVTERLVEQMSKEICERRPALLLTHALLKGQTKDYLRVCQERLLLQPVLDRLVSHFGSQEALEEQFDLLLQQLRTFHHAAQGYGGGNIVNLFIRLKGHIKGKDCSHLTVWQADLQQAEAQEANFSGTDLRGSVFQETISAISSVAVSVDGHYLAAGGYNGEIRLWRVSDGQLLLAWVGHNRLVWSLAFHPDGSQLVSGGYDGLVKVWDARTGQCVRVLHGHTKWVQSLAIHPTGKLLATCGNDGSIRFWDLVANGSTSVWHQQERGIWSLAFSPDGKFLASGDVDGEIKLWDLESQRCLWSVTTHAGSGTLTPRAIPSLAFSPNGEMLVSGGPDAQIMVWETNNGTQLDTLFGHTAPVHTVAFNAEGVLASGGEDRSVKLWQAGPRGEASYSLGSLHGHTGTLWSVALGPDGLLVSGSEDGLIKIWQIDREDRGGRCLTTLCGHSRMINAAAFSPDGRLLVSHEQDGTVRMWEMASGRCLRILSRRAHASSALAFRPDGRLFASGVSGTLIELWDVENGRSVRTLQGHWGHIHSLAFSPDGRFLVSSGLDTMVKRWEVDSGQCLNTFQGHRNWVWPVAYSPDGKLLASGDVGGVVKVWEVESGRCLHTLQGSPQAIVALLFTPDSQILLSSNAQDLVTMWDVQRGQCLKVTPGVGDTYWLRSVALSADGNFLAAKSYDQTIKIWDIKRGEIVRTLSCPAGQPWSMAWSADQHLLACGTDMGTILLWERQTGKCLMTLCSDRPYERMNISEVTGITEAQRATLKTLGAIEKEMSGELS